jgi:hypothetical protein
VTVIELSPESDEFARSVGRPYACCTHAGVICFRHDASESRDDQCRECFFGVSKTAFERRCLGFAKLFDRE